MFGKLEHLDTNFQHTEDELNYAEYVHSSHLGGGPRI